MVKKPVFRYEYYVKYLYFPNIQCLKWPETILRKDISLWRYLPVSYFSLLAFEGWSERYNSKDTLSVLTQSSKDHSSGICKVVCGQDEWCKYYSCLLYFTIHCQFFAFSNHLQVLIPLLLPGWFTVTVQSRKLLNVTWWWRRWWPYKIPYSEIGSDFSVNISDFSVNISSSWS